MRDKIKAILLKATDVSTPDMLEAYPKWKQVIDELEQLLKDKPAK